MEWKQVPEVTRQSIVEAFQQFEEIVRLHAIPPHGGAENRVTVVAIVLSVIKERGETGDDSDLYNQAFNLCSDATDF